MKRLLAFISAMIGFSALAITPSDKSFDQDMFFTNNPAVGSFIGVRNFMFGTNVLVIDNHLGNDTNAVADPYRRFWRTAYDIYNTNGPVSYGAITAARAGDWIMFTPSATPYLIPSLPLNLKNPGINLYVPAGVILIRTNFSNTNATGQLTTSLSKTGPLIVPGNSSQLIIDGTVISTNDPAFDATLGYSYTATAVAASGVTNSAATNWSATGRGSLRGNTDVVYVSHTNAGSMFLSRLNLYSDWDAIFLNDSAQFNLSVFTLNLNVHSTSAFNGASHAVVNQCGNFVDCGSLLAASGASSGANNNAAIWSSFAASNPGGNLRAGVLSLYGSQLVNEGSSSNFAPLVIQNTLLSGNWAEFAMSNLWTRFTASDYTGSSIRSNGALYTNIVLSATSVSPAAAAGPFIFNSAGTWNWTNSFGTSWITNNVPGDLNFLLLRTPTGSGSFKFYTTNGLFGTWWATNTGVNPGPTFAYSNFLSVVVSQVSLGQIIGTNFISGQMYTNDYGRNIEVLANAVLTEAAVAGASALELRVVGYATNSTSALTAISGLVGSVTNLISGFIPTNAPFTFTNVSSGAGNSATVTGGQIIIH